MRKNTTEEFIRKAKSVHGGTYRYDSTEYDGNKIKVEILCEVHGAFMQMPINHLRGAGCKACATEKNPASRPSSSAEVIAGFRSVHGDRYCYKSMDYKGGGLKVEIVCKEHGSFMQTPGNHAAGHGCRKCSTRENPASARMGQADAIAGFRSIHGDRYSYASVIYERSSAPVVVTCRVHGDFKIRPNCHMNGSGCPKCGQVRRGRSYSGGLQRFLEKAVSVHGDRFDYSSAIYRGSSEKLEITCRDHGPFWMSASAHLVGQKCPLCYDVFRKPAHVYVLRGGGMSKVGIAVDPHSRLAKIKKSSGIDAEIFCSFLISDRGVARKVEGEAHMLLASSRAGLSGFDGCTEWFECNAGEAVSAIVTALHAEGISHRKAMVDYEKNG